MTPEQNDGSYFDSLIPHLTRADLEREMAKIFVPRKESTYQMTPEQMRALADALTAEADYYDSSVDCLENRSAIALRGAADGIEFQATQIAFSVAQYRAAADQLEAVRKYAEANYSASTVARQIVRMMKEASDD